ncbi:MAG: sulfatase-like hydrolase/transferase [Myxococcota bacterium]
MTGLLAATLACSPDRPSHPDLVLVTLDALPAAALACFGGVAGAGPGLCAQAEGGTRFAWAVSAARGEASSAATVLTGVPPHRHPVGDDGASFLPHHFETIAEQLSAIGFRTAAFVTSPRLNRTRRLDQGFAFYDDRLPGLSDRDAPEALAQAVQAWIGRGPGPRFVWLHLSQAGDLGAVDRALARVDVALGERRRRGMLIAGLAGDREASPLEWARHRVPLVWRSPNPAPKDAPGVSFRLADLEDVRPTLLAAGGLAGEPTRDPSAPPLAGRDLGLLARAPRSTEAEDERRVLLGGGGPDAAVGLATATHVYARARTAFDGSGDAVPTETLGLYDARFLPLPLPDPVRHPAPRSAALRPGPWRRDVLATDSPVPSLEFHLARRLAEALREEVR